MRCNTILSLPRHKLFLDFISISSFFELVFTLLLYRKGYVQNNIFLVIYAFLYSCTKSSHLYMSQHIEKVSLFCKKIRICRLLQFTRIIFVQFKLKKCRLHTCTFIKLTCPLSSRQQTQG